MCDVLWKDDLRLFDLFWNLILDTKTRKLPGHVFLCYMILNHLELQYIVDRRLKLHD